MKKRKPRSQGVQSLDTGIAVVFKVARAGRPVALTDISNDLGLLPSTVHRHLASLSRAGLIEQAGPSGAYDLGPAAIEFGLAALGRLDSQKLWNEAIERLRDQTDLTSLVIVWGTHGPTVVQWKESRQAVWLNAHVGTVLPMVRSAAGLVFCAYPPSRETAALIDREFASGPAPTNRRRKLTGSAFQSLLAKIRRTGYADIDGDLIEGVAAASAPVFDSTGNVKLVLSILGPSSMVRLEPAGPHVKSLLNASRALSNRLGYVPEKPS
jgi:DNA-binding IclR family transcriptional regulator